MNVEKLEDLKETIESLKDELVGIAERREIAEGCLQLALDNRNDKRVTRGAYIDYGVYKDTQFRGCTISGGNFIACEFVACEFVGSTSVGQYDRCEYSLCVFPANFDCLKPGERINRDDPAAVLTAMPFC